MADPIGLLDKGPCYGTNGTVCNPRRAHGVYLSLSVSSCYRTLIAQGQPRSLARTLETGNPDPQLNAASRGAHD